MALLLSMTSQGSRGYFSSLVKVMPRRNLKHGVGKCREEKMEGYSPSNVTTVVSSRMKNLKSFTLKKK